MLNLHDLIAGLPESEQREIDRISQVVLAELQRAESERLSEPGLPAAGDLSLHGSQVDFPGDVAPL
jgi:hypothetical protein